MARKVRIDQLMVDRGITESRNRAQRLVMAGQVRVEGQVVPKPSSKYTPQVEITIDQGPRFVSRGGEKLQAAFEAFNLDVAGKICADVGASTGGFTDCLLQHGASKVYAVDVGKGILHWKLRNDPRVQVMEGINARYLKKLPGPVSFVVVDVSFISLKVMLPVINGWFTNYVSESEFANGGRDVLTLIKPQFEAGRKAVARGKGVIRDSGIHRRVLVDVLSYALEINFKVKGLTPSPVQGPKGNVEFLAWLAYSDRASFSEVPIDDLISKIIPSN